MSEQHFNFNELSLIHFADQRMNTRPPAFDFEADGAKAKELAEGLYQKMLELGGVGLSANQLGLPYRVFVTGMKGVKNVFFNPQILGVSKETELMEEGCLSFPGFFLALQRPKSVAIQYYDEEGKEQTSVFSGVGARVILHEYDHMEGINFTHHASTFKLKWQLDKMKKKQQKLMRRAKRAR